MIFNVPLNNPWDIIENQPEYIGWAVESESELLHNTDKIFSEISEYHPNKIFLRIDINKETQFALKYKLKYVGNMFRVKNGFLYWWHKSPTTSLIRTHINECADKIEATETTKSKLDHVQVFKKLPKLNPASHIPEAKPIISQHESKFRTPQKNFPLNPQIQSIRYHSDIQPVPASSFKSFYSGSYHLQNLHKSNLTLANIHMQKAICENFRFYLRQKTKLNLDINGSVKNNLS